MVCAECSAQGIVGIVSAGNGFDNAMDIWDIRDSWDPDTGLWSKDSFPVKVSVRVRARARDIYYTTREFISNRLA